MIRSALRHPPVPRRGFTLESSPFRKPFMSLLLWVASVLGGRLWDRPTDAVQGGKHQMVGSRSKLKTRFKHAVT